VISNHLIDDLEPYLRQAEEFWIVVALMKDAGLEELQSWKASRYAHQP
jgi:hypothetical protein